MDKLFRYALCGAALLATMFAGPAIAESVRPDLVQFFAEQKDDVVARTCNLSTVVLTDSDAVNFRLIVALPRTGPTAFYGFSIDAGKPRIEDGKPNGKLHQFQLADADVTSDGFDSATSLRRTPQRDMGILKGTIDEAVARTYVQGILSGRFSISVKRPEGEWRSYLISQSVPKAERDQLFRCIGTFNQ